MSTLPLFKTFDDTPLAWHRGAYISRQAFIADVLFCASTLPDRSHVLNRCEDRYLFLVGFAAAMLRNQITVCPPALTTPFLAYIKNAFPGVYCLSDNGEYEGLVTIAATRSSGQHGDTATPEIAGQQIVLIAFTSGSTGTPGQHPKTWAALVQGVARQSVMLGVRAGGATGVVATVPPQHMYGLESSIIMPLQMGWMMHGGKPFFPSDIQTALTQSMVHNILVTTPFHLRACVDSRLELPHIEFVLSATAPLSQALALAAENAFGTRVLEIYGCTEAGSIASRRSTEGPLWQLHDGLNLTIEHPQRCHVHGAHSSEPMPLNDVITLRDTRHFLLEGRSQDLVNIAGKRASLGDLNQTLTSVDGVIDGVFFMPEGPADGVTRLVAFVVAPGRGASEVLDGLRDRIDPVFIPRPLYLVDALPRNATGKLPIECLHALARSSAAGEQATA